MVFTVGNVSTVGTVSMVSTVGEQRMNLQCTVEWVSAKKFGKEKCYSTCSVVVELIN
jgi:hypothetical protein